jgi:lipoprotein NlpD
MGAESRPPPSLADKREAAEQAAAASGVITSPQATKLPYSQAALAKLQGTPAVASAPATPPPAPAERAEPPASSERDAVAWGWPTQGRVIAGFNENGGPKGVQIAGSLGQAIVASAPGRVVYTGSGLRGYGNLVIIKHNDTYLSAYAHNRSVLVKQGENVTKGQKIAEMGDSDASRVMLHFEIRRMGKPVDPIKFLPPT